MKENFSELWDGSRAFRQLFLHNGIFKSANNVDVGKAEVLWWNRHPHLLWDFCNHDGCGRLAVRGEYCQDHIRGSMPTWKWHSGILYRYMFKPGFVGDKGNNGGMIPGYVAYHKHLAEKLFKEIPAGYDVHYEDANPFNLRKENLILLSKVMIAAVRAGVINVQVAMDLDDVLADAMAEKCLRGRPKSEWTYDMVAIAEAAGVTPRWVWKEISKGKIDPSNLASVIDFCHRSRGGDDRILSKLSEIG